MSKLKQPNGDDHPDAAAKHLCDSLTLLSNHRPDGAAYLSGYVVECALKTLLLLETGTSPQTITLWTGRNGHDLKHLASQASTLASVAGSKTARYLKSATSSISSTAIANWSPGIRYREPHLTHHVANTWHSAAKDVYDETIAAMHLDGVL